MQLDGGTPQNAAVSGSSPNYTWSLQLSEVKKGSHTLKATLLLGGVEKATDRVTFTKK